MLFQLLLLVYINQCKGIPNYFAGGIHGNIDQSSDPSWCKWTVDEYNCDNPIIAQSCPNKCFTGGHNSQDCGIVKSYYKHSEEADLHEYPWHVAIYYKYGFRCEGVLISDIFVATTSSCLSMMTNENTTREQIIVTIGDHDLSTDDETDSKTVHPQTIIQHAQYNYPVPLNNDIGLLKLESPVTLSHDVSPICLPNPGLNYGNVMATIASWGRDSMSNNLKESAVGIMRNDECKLVRSRDWIYKKIQPGQMCSIATKGSAKSCANNRGTGVLVWEDHHWILIGLTSSSKGCGYIKKPAIITRITEYVDWIKKNVNSDTMCQDNSTTKCFNLCH